MSCKDKFTNLVVVVCLTSIINCGSASNFSASSSSRQNKTQTADIKYSENKELKTKEYTIGSKETKGEVDIAWVVDESGSMQDDVARVNANLAAFEEKLENFANLKSYLSNKNRWAVHSRNGPDCLLASLGLENLENLNNPFPSPFPSDVKPPSPWFNSFFNTDNIVPSCLHATDSLKNFYRKNSKKIAIFVTDDDSYLSAQQIQNKLSNTSYSDIVFYAFASPGLNHCPTQAAEGTVYRELTNSSKGELFNLCSPDWSNHYNKLTENIKKMVISDIDTDLDSTATIVEVLLNDETLAESDYSFSEGILKANEDVLKEGDKLIIKYQE